jgi:hypothetical protein
LERVFREVLAVAGEDVVETCGLLLTLRQRLGLQTPAAAVVAVGLMEVRVL